MRSFHGTPIWYEYVSRDLDASAKFYSALFGWSLRDSGMPGMDYRLAASGGDIVAGLSGAETGQSGWLIYFGCDNCDDSAASVSKAGGTILTPPQNIPGTGRFAIVADPQGARFGLLQPDLSQMTTEQIDAAASGGSAFSPLRPGHGGWNELMSQDPEMALDFYLPLLGWTKGERLEMAGVGGYQMIQVSGKDIGAITGLGMPQTQLWLPYFTLSQTVTQAAAQIDAGGGSVAWGPVEVPGPAYIAMAKDPLGHWFAVVGTKL